MRKRMTSTDKQTDDKKNIQYVKPKTEGQKELVRAIAENSIVLVCGPSGTGKTHLSICLACQYLSEGKIKKIILSRPIVSASVKNMGALPGSMREKIDPYLIPVIEEMKKYFSHQEVEKFIRDGIVELVPLEYMRGRTFDDAFMILDESENAEFAQLTMFLTRIGQNSKAVANGDIEQTDLVKNAGAFEEFLDLMENIKDIEVVELGEEDIVRNKLIKDILRAVARRT